MKPQFLCSLAAALLIPLAALAQQDGACRPDVERFCRQSQGDPKAATDCLLDHQQDISDACYNQLKQQLTQGGGNADKGGGGHERACRQDAEALCKGVQPGGGRIVNCLMDHQKELSDACYDQLSKAMKRKRS